MSNTEAKVINAICQNKDISVLMQDNVDDLFVSHGDIWKSLKEYYSKYRAVPDIEILQGKYSDLEKIDTKAETPYLVDELRNEYIRSRMEGILMKAANMLQKDTPPRTLEKLTGELGKLGKYTNTVRDLDITDFEQAERDMLRRKERSDAMGGSPGIPTGFKAIDANYPTGMAPGHLIVCIGWPGKAKTWFTGYLACKAWEAGFKPMIFSLEMSPETMRDRIYTMMGSGLFRNSDFSRGDIDIDDLRTWGKKRFDNKQGFVLVSPEGYNTVTPNVVQAKIDQHKPGLVICDYHQLFTDNARSQGSVESAKNVSREFKMLATANGIPLIDITAATADDVSDRKSPPMMSQVAWSKSIEYDADLAFAVHRNDDSGLVEVVSRKNRHGGDFGFFLNWDIDRGIITEQYDL